MRYLFGFVCVLALGLMGCSEAAGTGGSGGTAGDGGAGGGMPECQSPEDCDDDNECTDDTCLAGGVCEFMPVPDPTGPDEPGDPPGEGTTCGYYMGTCEGGSCAGTFACTEAGIREAIAAGAGPHTFGCNGPQTVVTVAEIIIDNNVILDGEGNLTVDGNDDHRVFSVTQGVTAELRGITVFGGWRAGDPKSSGGGAGIYNAGTLTLTNSTVRRNAIVWGCGGGINNFGTLTARNCTVSDNTAAVFGGGICNAGTLTLTNSTVFENRVSGIEGYSYGGGIYSDATLTITNSTVSGNSASVGSDLLNGFVEATSTITNSTVSGHISNSGTLIVTNSVFAARCADELITSNGYNIESPGNTCGFDQGTDQVNVSADDLKLGPLADNGGPTMTHALEAGSVAIDVIPEDDCVDAEGELLAADQRGEPRFVGLPFGPFEPVGDGCDVGAFEVQPAPAEGCIQSGGTVSTALCCQSVESFPNTCLVGACGCAPDASHEVDFCICPANTCFDGESCVAQ